MAESPVPSKASLSSISENVLTRVITPINRLTSRALTWAGPHRTLDADRNLASHHRSIVTISPPQVRQGQPVQMAVSAHLPPPYESRLVRPPVDWEWTPEALEPVVKRLLDAYNKIDLVSHRRVPFESSFYQALQLIFLTDPAFVKFLHRCELPIHETMVPYLFMWRLPTHRPLFRRAWFEFLVNFMKAQVLTASSAQVSTRLVFECWVMLWKQMWGCWESAWSSEYQDFMLSDPVLNRVVRFLAYEKNFIRVLKHSIEYIPRHQSHIVLEWHRIHSILLQRFASQDNNDWSGANDCLSAMHEVLQVHAPLANQPPSTRRVVSAIS